MGEILLGALVGVTLANTVALAMVCRLLRPSPERRGEEAVETAVDEEAKRSRAMDEGFDNLMRYSVRGQDGLDAGDRL